jgi:prolyl-tRNA synthetase
MIASIAPLSYRQLPLRLYQITQKFRDEMKPRFGLMRTKEFLMKDLYTFDANLEAARRTYDDVNLAYQHLLSEIGVPFVKVAGDTGIIGGSQSHEYHYTSSIGEDQLLTCTGCKYATNKELQTNGKCRNCGGEQLLQQPGIEVAHTFILEDKYSKLLGATYLQANGKPTPLIMGCYGIGVTRLLAASVECLSTETEIRWPFALAPFRVCILPPKSGSKEEAATQHWTQQLHDELQRHPHLTDSVLIDDRTNLTIGKRLLEANRMGYPLIVVVGAKAADPLNPLFEFHNLLDGRRADLTHAELIGELASCGATNETCISNENKKVTIKMT